MPQNVNNNIHFVAVAISGGIYTIIQAGLCFADRTKITEEVIYGKGHVQLREDKKEIQ